MRYCESVYKTQRWKTREVRVGNVGVGASNPVRIQSMTTSNTRDVEATIDQIIRLADAGCEIARVTVQGMKEADACEGIKNGLLKKGYTIPVVADIHFFPPAAMRVVEFVDKVRVNPGNFVDKRASFKVIDYDDTSYELEIERIEEKFAPLVEKCKTLKKAMRIGTNHGSLSDRIMNRYGDTPKGMVEAAFEFARVCRKYNYHDIIFSMKSSNPQVMVQAYRLLVAEMMKVGWDYPLHLGVTEAGEGEDGRIKSAMGIGALLLDGIGDTIRVSLTEDPWYEMDPCQRLVALAKSYEGRGIEPFEELSRDFQSIQKRGVNLPKNVSLHRDGTVMVPIKTVDLYQSSLLKNLGCEGPGGKPKLKMDSADHIVLTHLPKDEAGMTLLTHLRELGIGIASPHYQPNGLLIRTLSQAIDEFHMRMQTKRFAISFANQAEPPLAVIVSHDNPSEWDALKKILPAVIFLSPAGADRLHLPRKFFEWLNQEKINIPVILNFSYQCSKEDLVIHAATECGALLCDGLGEGILFEGPYEISFLRNLSFGILQAARMRTSKTEFISCPSCGRTLFDLQDVSRRIRERTAHLPGVKIAIMGCIVNGPGEMADADFGYVGSKAGKIDLYVGKQCVEKDIDFADADDRLVALIKAHGKWKEKEESALDSIQKRTEFSSR